MSVRGLQRCCTATSHSVVRMAASFDACTFLYEITAFSNPSLVEAACIYEAGTMYQLPCGFHSYLHLLLTLQSVYSFEGQRQLLRMPGCSSHSTEMSMSTMYCTGHCATGASSCPVNPMHASCMVLCVEWAQGLVAVWGHGACAACTLPCSRCIVSSHAHCAGKQGCQARSHCIVCSEM